MPTPLFDTCLSSDDLNAFDASQKPGTTTFNTLASLTELYDAIPASIIIIDERMRLIGWNRFSRDTINGLSDNEMPGINPMKRVHPDDLPEMIRKMRNVIDLDIELSAEFRMYHKSGPPYKWAMCRGKRTIIEGKTCVVAVVTEITDLKEAEEQRKKLQEQLLQLQKMELVGQLASGIAHDFNNALAAIIGNTELALKKLDPANPAVSNITDIHTLATRSANLTRQLLAFARKQMAMPRVLNLTEEVSDCLRLYQRLIDKNIHLEWHLCDEPIQVKLDPTQLEQILSNLLVNARDAIDGSGCITVRCEGARFEPTDGKTCNPRLSPGDYARLSITDSGCGIEASVLPHIYEPFFTTKEIGKGIGLGLSSVYGIVRQNNGHIECHSEPGKGTTFDIWLPLHQESQQKTDVHADKPQTELKTKAKIMVVEDEPYILKLVQDILESHEFTVFTATDADQCLLAAKTHEYRIDLLVTDVVLPTMNGIEQSRVLQKKNPAMKCLFMSAHAPDNVDGQKKLRVGVDFIEKPFGIDEFLRAIDQVLNSEVEKI
ncbi:MAG TPA: PAS domain-containing sensor histidine kinase [Chlorobaculum sp.]|uniref:histidine kinase n=1 Tax=Chlorobaculum tepidum (strain ATCC 49652 / DSM 12025 / NBRC 103806 / TLS) TaxID=194439 RepID=Q8KBT7_CHLTE|nr:PAS domain-containing sensor histidine kinase [Chlorobaculum tepidum]AAM72920.1 sensor histidine kinase/response regulator [Chlorobaculum tepidum TLS]HBU22548.1 PAS domain-containing sensor histidine kinase [Chlorobaculum sp.]